MEVAAEAACARCVESVLDCLTDHTTVNQTQRIRLKAVGKGESKYRSKKATYYYCRLRMKMNSGFSCLPSGLLDMVNLGGNSQGISFGFFPTKTARGRRSRGKRSSRARSGTVDLERAIRVVESDSRYREWLYDMRDLSG